MKRAHPSSVLALRSPAFEYRGSGSRARAAELYCEGVALEDLAARHGTPLYVYSTAMIRARMDAFARAFRSAPHTLCYSVKANSNLAILRLLAGEGAGFDVVSGGELERVLRVNPKAAGTIVFSGVG
jgi:diaminopimelate decarboxylase